MIRVVRIPLDDIMEDNIMNGRGTRKFNNGSEYRSESRDRLSTWLPYLGKYMRKPYFWTYTLKNHEIDVLAQSSRLAVFCKRVSPLYKEDLDEIVERMKGEWREGEWMFRLDNASSKDSSVCQPPYRSPQDVVYSMATSDRCYGNCFQDRNRELNKTLYFSHFDRTWNQFAEWRVFIFKGRVVAITQYACYSLCPVLSKMSDEYLTVIAHKILNYAQKVLHVSGIKKLTDTLVLDLYYDPVNIQDNSITPSVVEINNYYDSGSGLFSWADLDEKLITAEDFVLQIRVVKEKKVLNEEIIGIDGKTLD